MVAIPSSNSNPASIGTAYDPNGPNGPIPYPGKRVSLRAMDQNMKDASAQNIYLGIEHSFWTNFMFRVNYQGSLGRHAPMLENYNRYPGDAYGVASPTSLSAILPNPLYNGFNYRSNSVNSNYNAFIAELQKRTSNGLQFQTSYTFSKLLDVNSDLFAACSNIGGAVGTTAPYYYINNANPGQLYGPAAYDHRHAFKFSLTYELPFLKSQKGFAAKLWAAGPSAASSSITPAIPWTFTMAARASPRRTAAATLSSIRTASSMTSAAITTSTGLPTITPCLSAPAFPRSTTTAARAQQTGFSPTMPASLADLRECLQALQTPPVEVARLPALPMPSSPIRIIQLEPRRLIATVTWGAMSSMDLDSLNWTSASPKPSESQNV
jgi:hypothetical protein